MKLEERHFVMAAVIFLALVAMMIVQVVMAK